MIASGLAALTLLAIFLLLRGNSATTLDGPLTADGVSACLQANDFVNIQSAVLDGNPNVLARDPSGYTASIAIFPSVSSAQSVPFMGISTASEETNGRTYLITDSGMSADSLEAVRGCSTEGS